MAHAGELQDTGEVAHARCCSLPVMNWPLSIIPDCTFSAVPSLAAAGSSAASFELELTASYAPCAALASLVQMQPHW